MIFSSVNLFVLISSHSHVIGISFISLYHLWLVFSHHYIVSFPGLYLYICTKFVFGVSDQVQLKSGCTTTEDG